MVDANQPQPFVVARHADSTVVTIVGEFDILTVRQVARDVDKLVADAPASIVIDMSALEFIDSSGIALLLRIHNAVVKEAGGELRVVNPSETARRTFDLTGLSEAFGFDQ